MKIVRDNIQSGWLYTLTAPLKKTFDVNIDTAISIKGGLANNKYFAVVISEASGSDAVTISIDAKEGYSWDGASTPVMNGADLLYPSLWHDILYQCLRVEQRFNDAQRNKLKLAADMIFRDACLLVGVSKFRAITMYAGLRAFGSPSCERDDNGTDPRDPVLIDMNVPF